MISFPDAGGSFVWLDKVTILPAIVRETWRRILITGAGGFIGGALARRLEAEGHGVRALDLPSVIAHTDTRAPVAHDLTTPVPIALLADIDLVIHAAALAGVRSSWECPEAYWRVNATATERLRRTCERAGAPRVLHLSSISVYGAGLNLSERSTPHPVSPYGRSKLAGERAWDGYPRATIVRLSNVYGPGQRSDMAYATFIRAGLAARPIVLRDGGRQLRTPTYIDDCVAGILAAARHARDGETYNIAGPEDIRLSEIPRILASLLGRPVGARAAAPAPGDPRVATVSSDLARHALGYAPRTSVSAGLAMQFEAWRELAAPAVAATATS
jgi:UDP-glucuronate 4-epimerase